LRAFDLPGVPHLVVADVEGAAVAGDEEPLDDLLFLDGLHRRRDIIRAEAHEHAAHRVEELRLLILAQVRAAESRQIRLALRDHLRGLLTARLAGDEDFLLLLAVERAVELVEEQTLIPERIPLVVLRFAERLREVPVEDGRAAKAA